MATIVHATDFSRASTRAFEMALTLAQSRRARLVLVHVRMPPSPFIGGSPPATWVDLERRARQRAERRLAALVERARAAGVRVRAELLDGDPADTILRVARRECAEEIAMGSHGRSPLGRWLMGSVANHVLSRAPCPVLTTRAGG